MSVYLAKPFYAVFVTYPGGGIYLYSNRFKFIMIAQVHEEVFLMSDRGGILGDFFDDDCAILFFILVFLFCSVVRADVDLHTPNKLEKYKIRCCRNTQKSLHAIYP